MVNEKCICRSEHVDQFENFDLAKLKLPLGMGGTINVYGYITLGGKPHFVLLAQNDNEISEDQIAMVPVQYCPFCGRKLYGTNDVDFDVSLTDPEKKLEYLGGVLNERTRYC